MDQSFKKLEVVLKKHPSLDSSSDEIEEILSSLNLEAVTEHSRSNKINSILSLPSAFKGESIPPVDPNNVCMSMVPRGYKFVSKITSPS